MGRDVAHQLVATEGQPPQVREIAQCSRDIAH